MTEPTDDELDKLIRDANPTQGLRHDSRDLPVLSLRKLMREAIAKWGTPAGAAPVTKERFSEPLARVINAGYLLANCAFNLAQRPGTEISIGTAKTLSDCRKEWDAACAAHKALPPPPKTPSAQQ